MNELNITGICANTSSAKGRVERAQLTLQDRLVKELRLRGISTPEAANAFADEFMADYNRRFAKPPRHDFDVHRPLEKAPKCCLLIFIDDATGRLMHFRFGEAESAFHYMMASREYLERYGKPLTFYSDKYGIFWANNGGSTTACVTQFGGVLSELGTS